jgi:hypothetical protein
MATACFKLLFPRCRNHICQFAGVAARYCGELFWGGDTRRAGLADVMRSALVWLQPLSTQLEGRAFDLIATTIYASSIIVQSLHGPHGRASTCRAVSRPDLKSRVPKDREQFFAKFPKDLTDGMLDFARDELWIEPYKARNPFEPMQVAGTVPALSYSPELPAPIG